LLDARAKVAGNGQDCNLRNAALGAILIYSGVLPIFPMSMSLPSIEMGPTKERRHETRFASQLPVRVWGCDENGERFVQDATARNLSYSGALLAGIEHNLRCGDLLGVQYQNRLAHFRVIWVRDSRSVQKVQVAVQRVGAYESPWKSVLEERLTTQML
jgi:hypothetical protein